MPRALMDWQKVDYSLEADGVDLTPTMGTLGFLSSVILALTGGACTSIGVALQSRSASTVPDVPEADLDISQPLETIEALREYYVSDSMFVVGVGLEIAGGLIALLAMKFLGIEETHQAGVLGLAMLALVSVKHLREYHSKQEWIGITLAALCTFSVAGAFTHGVHRGKEWTQSWEMELGSTYIMILSVVFLYIGWYFITKLRESAGPKASTPMSVLEEAPRRTRVIAENVVLPGTSAWQDTFVGIIVGALFGMAAAMNKCGFLVADKSGFALWDVVGISIAVVLVAGAVIVRTEALRRGSTMIVCTVSRMTAISTVVLVSTVFLDEALSVDTRYTNNPDEAETEWTDAQREFIDSVNTWRLWRVGTGYAGMFIAVIILMSTNRSASPLRAAMAAKDG